MKPLVAAILPILAVGAAPVDAQVGNRWFSLESAGGTPAVIVLTDARGGRVSGVTIEADQIELRGDTIVLSTPARLVATSTNIDLLARSAVASVDFVMSYPGTSISAPHTVLARGSRVQVSQAPGQDGPTVHASRLVVRP